MKIELTPVTWPWTSSQHVSLKSTVCYYLLQQALLLFSPLRFLYTVHILQHSTACRMICLMVQPTSCFTWTSTRRSTLLFFLVLPCCACCFSVCLCVCEYACMHTTITFYYNTRCHLKDDTITLQDCSIVKDKEHK